MFKQIQNCQICENEGNKIFSLEFQDEALTTFFNSYYEKNKSENILKIIKDHKYTLLNCSTCEFIWQLNQPDEHLSLELYENLIDKELSFKKSIQVLENSKKRFFLEGRYLQNYFNKKDLNILDYGAGWGSWLKAIKKLNNNLFAIEMSLERIKHLNSNQIKIIDLKSIKKYKNFFDIIRIEQVLEHVGEINVLMYNLNYMLKNKGILCVGVPDGNKIIQTKKIKIEKGPTQPLEHLNCFNNKSLKLLMKKHGFRHMEKSELIYSHLKGNVLSYDKLKFLLSDFKMNFYSTSLKFIKI